MPIDKEKSPTNSSIEEKQYHHSFDIFSSSSDHYFENFTAEEKDLFIQEIQKEKETIKKIYDTINQIYLGRPDIVELVFAGLLAQGHILLEGNPGVAKTTLVKTFAYSLGATFQRIQFTPDLLPADITGSYIYNMKEQDFYLRRGPLFANIVLADEINRAPAKTQSAMLEAMAEQQVTIEGERHPLQPPFMVLATQNPIEQEGVYMLPEAQLDRFLMKLQLDFPARDVERKMLRLYRRSPQSIAPLIESETILHWQALVEKIYIHPELEEYILDLISYTRHHPQIHMGASPRGTLALHRTARALAFLRGRHYVIPDDIRNITIPTLAHRIILYSEAELDGILPQHIIQQGLQELPFRQTTFQPE